MPIIAGSSHGCTITSGSAVGPAAPVIGAGCAYAGRWIGENVARAIVQHLGRTVDDETFMTTGVVLIGVGAGGLGASLAIKHLVDRTPFIAGSVPSGKRASQRTFALAIRELKWIAPKMLVLAKNVFDPDSPVSAIVSLVNEPPAVAAGAPCQLQDSCEMTDLQEARTPAFTPPGSP